MPEQPNPRPTSERPSDLAAAMLEIYNDYASRREGVRFAEELAAASVWDVLARVVAEVRALTAERDDLRGRIPVTIEMDTDSLRAEINRLILEHLPTAVAPLEAERDAALISLGGAVLTNERLMGVNAALASERDRLALILRCERGEWAPEGWAYSFSQGRWEHIADPFAKVWRNGWMQRADGSSYIAWGWETWPQGERVEGTAPTALEAIEAAGAAIREVSRG